MYIHAHLHLSELIFDLVFLHFQQYYLIFLWTTRAISTTLYIVHKVLDGVVGVTNESILCTWQHSVYMAAFCVHAICVGPRRRPLV